MPGDVARLKKALLELERDPDLGKMRVKIEELQKFNIFEAIGMGAFEIRHSNFLAYLLNPHESHGLRDSFVKGLLRMVSARLASRPEVDFSEIEGWSLGGLEVRRERDNMDIRLTDRAHKLVIVIENKTFSGEHGGQLARYAEIIRANYPDYRALFLYLSPYHEKPSDLRYLSVTYGDVEGEIRRILANPPPSANTEVLSLLEHHYLRLLRKEQLVQDKELDELASRVYREHQAAIDYVVKNQSLLGPIEELVKHQPELLWVNTTRKRVAFVVSEWKDRGLESPAARYGWKLQFQFRDEDEGLRLVLYLKPAQDELGRKIIAAARAAGNPFKLDPKRLGQDRVFLYDRLIRIRRGGDLDDDAPSEGDERLLRENWERFLTEDFPRIRPVITGALAIENSAGPSILPG